jgi:DNA polymerase III subunit epsilon
LLHAGLIRLPTDDASQPRGGLDWQARFAALAEQTKDARLRAYYSAGMPAGDTPIKDVPLMAMDVETTGLNPAKDGIVSIGIIPMTTTLIQSSASQHWIVQPHVPLADASVAIHGITHSQVADAPKLVDILGDVLSSIAGHVLVVHCRAIERSFLNNALTRLIHEPLEMPMIDTMELEARLYRNEPPPSWWDRVIRKKTNRPVSIRLADSRYRYGLPFYKPHHALTDALATAELLQAQIAHRFTPQTPLNDLWC